MAVKETVTSVMYKIMRQHDLVTNISLAKKLKYYNPYEGIELGQNCFISE